MGGTPMSEQICTNCGHEILPHELCCPICDNDETCPGENVPFIGEDDFDDLAMENPDMFLE
jgi:hypothetical protein